ncbi:Hexuronate transporter, partial [termite gut metagenome]
MSTFQKAGEKMTQYRWAICTMLFFATTVNYLDRQVLSLTWKDFIAPEFHWTNTDYGFITSGFSIIYALSMLFAGRLVDWLDTRRGYLWAIGIWSVGACIHAFCGIATSGILTGNWLVGFEGAKEIIATVGDVGKIVSISTGLFIFARFVLAIGESGNFPAAIKVTAEYFPKKDRAYSTSIFNAGAAVGALVAPVTIPFIAKAWGWEATFLLIGALGFLWMGVWIFVYKKPEKNPGVNAAELLYIQQDKHIFASKEEEANKKPDRKLSFVECFKFKQTWAFAFGKFMTDGVWWFFLFWTPAYLSAVYGMDSTQAALPLFVFYLITLLSIFGGWLPTYFVVKKGMNPYAGRMKAMLIFAFF